MTKLIGRMFFVLCAVSIYTAAHTQALFPLGIKAYESITPVVVTIPLPDAAAYNRNVAGTNKKISIRAGVDGVWTKLHPDYHTWLLRITSPGAEALALRLTSTALLKGEKLFIYNKNGIAGAFDMTTVPSTQTVPLPYLYGDELIVEYNVPASRTMQGSFVVETISRAHPGVFTSASLQSQGRENQDEPCYPCVNADFYKESKQAVLRIIIHKQNESLLCTGTLMNSTAPGTPPYILTAEHCIATEEDAANAVFTFNYEAPSCNATAPLSNQSFIGAHLRASSYDHDFALLELLNPPPLGFKPFYAGWEITDQHVNLLSCIHHPLGDAKRLSLSNGYAQPATFLEAGMAPRATNAFWRVVKWDLGVTQSGSSGAPLFNKYQRVIGSLAGGSSSCGYPFNDFFQRLSSSWRAADDPTKQLRCWLDPAGITNALDGVDPFEGIVPACDTVGNISLADPIALQTYHNGDGYYSGVNNDGIDTYAERFSNNKPRFLTGVVLYIGSINSNASGGIRLNVVTDNNGTPGVSLYNEYISYHKLKLFSNYVSLYPYVPVNGNFFITYTIEYSEGDTFALYQGPWGDAGTNTAFVRQDNAWKPLSAINQNGTGSSYYIEAVLCEDVGPIIPPKDEITFTFYPNPVKDKLFLEFPQQESKTVLIEVVNTQGSRSRTILDSYNGLAILNTSSFTPGLYFVRVTTDNRTFVAKILK